MKEKNPGNPLHEISDDQLSHVAGGMNRTYTYDLTGYHLGQTCPQCHHDIWTYCSAESGEYRFRCAACYAIAKQRSRQVIPMQFTTTTYPPSQYPQWSFQLKDTVGY